MSRWAMYVHPASVSVNRHVLGGEMTFDYFITLAQIGCYKYDNFMRLNVQFPFTFLFIVFTGYLVKHFTIPK